MLRARIPLLVLVVALLAASAAHAQSVREVAARVHERGDYGAQLRVGPGSEGVVFGGGSGEPRRSRHEDARPQRRPSGGGSLALPAGSGVVSYLLLAVVIVVIAGLLFAALRRMRPQAGELAPRRSARDDGASNGAAPLPVRNVADPNADPDALAAQGRFAEAIAVALLRGLFAVGWRPEGHAKSRTAREILAAVPPGDPRHASLAALVTLEERIAFGGDEADEARWRDARLRWLELTREGAFS